MSWPSSIIVALLTVTDSSSRVLKMHQVHAAFIILFSDVAKDVFEDVTDDSWK